MSTPPVKQTARKAAVGLALLALVIYLGYIAWIGIRF